MSALQHLATILADRDVNEAAVQAQVTQFVSLAAVRVWHCVRKYAGNPLMPYGFLSCWKGARVQVGDLIKLR